VRHLVDASEASDVTGRPPATRTPRRPYPPCQSRTPATIRAHWTALRFATSPSAPRQSLSRSMGRFCG